MRKPAMPVGDDADRQRHQRHPVQLAPPILPKEIPCPPVLLVVLQRHQRVEDLEDLAADRADLAGGNDEDEVVSPDVTHEAPWSP